MSKSAKRFGMDKQSKPRKRRKQAVSEFIPLAIVPRSNAPIVAALFKRSDDIVEIDPSLQAALG
jgi:hypothetical protein